LGGAAAEPWLDAGLGGKRQARLRGKSPTNRVPRYLKTEVHYRRHGNRSSQKTVDNAAGRYLFSNISPSVYDVKVAKAGFSQVRMQGQKVKSALC